MITTVNIDDNLVAAGKQHARDLAKKYGVPVSFSVIIRRALTAYFIENSIPFESPAEPPTRENEHVAA